jgi:amino acid transporter
LCRGHRENPEDKKERDKSLYRLFVLLSKENSIVITENTPIISEEETPEDLVSEVYSTRTMPPVAGTFGLTATFVLIIFFITNVPSAIQAGAGTFTYWVIGGITFFIPCAIVTAQLGHMLPHEGSLYNWTHKAFGGYWSFFVAFCAWFPCILLMVTAASVVVGYLQGLNSTWLVAPWQQGLVLVLLIAFSGLLAVQPFRTVLNVVKVTLCIAFLAVFLVGIAGVAWLLAGKHAVAHFSTLADWGMTWHPTSYSALALFGFIIQAFLGIEVPLNMAGEVSKPRAITRHLLWGTLLVLLGYFVATFGVLVVRGTADSGNPFVLVLAVNDALGKTMGTITAALIIFNFVVTPAVYSYAYARLLMVGGMDQRLPVNIARLNKHRVPANAIIFQTIVAIIFTAVIYIAVPSFANVGNAATLNSDVYNVIISASTLVWAISTAFIFIDLAKLYFKDRQAFLARLIFPLPILWICIILGTITCVVSIVGTLLYSLIPQQIDNNHWGLLVGGITAICLAVAAIGSMFANGEADWEKLKE